MGVRKHIDVQIELEESTHAIAITNNGSLNANKVFGVSLDLDAVSSFVEHSNSAGIGTILVDEFSAVGHERYNILFVIVTSDVIVVGVFSSVVINRCQVETLVGTWSWDFHGVKKGETTGVTTCVRDEIFLLTSFSGGVVVIILREKVVVSCFGTSIECLIVCVSDFSGRHLVLIEAVVVGIPVIFECKDIVIRARETVRVICGILRFSFETIRESRPKVISSRSGESIVC
jgi:hypothetical protein